MINSDELIKSIKDAQLNLIVFDEKNKVVWDEKINSINDAKLFFSFNKISYDKEYYEVNNEIVLAIEFNSCFYLFKMFIKDSEVLFFSPFIDPNFDYLTGVKINKIIFSFFNSLNLKLRFFNLPRVNSLTENFKLLFSSISIIESSYDMYVDLTFSENELWKSLRKSYKSLINSSVKQIIFKNEVDKKDFLLCKNFHHKVAGRKTRNDETWKLQYESIIMGESKIFMAFDFEKKLLGFSLFQIGDSTVSYSVGAYNRDKFKTLAISHSLIWKSILFFKESHQQLYLGNTSYKKEIFDQKLKNINQFKLGFSSKTESNPYLV